MIAWADLAVLLWVPAIGAYYGTVCYIAWAWRDEDGRVPSWTRRAATCMALFVALALLGPTYERVMSR
jgi:hypothetical protein